MSAKTIFCRFCGTGAHRYGLDRKRRQRYFWPHRRRPYTRRTNTVKSGSHLSDRQWQRAAESLCTRAGMSGPANHASCGSNEKTGQRLNRIFRSLVRPLTPAVLPGVSEWDESAPRPARGCLEGCPGTRGSACCAASATAGKTP